MYQGIWYQVPDILYQIAGIYYHRYFAFGLREYVAIRHEVQANLKCPLEPQTVELLVGVYESANTTRGGKRDRNIAAQQKGPV